MFKFLWATGNNNGGSSDWFTQYGWIITLVLSIIFVAAFVIVVILLIKTKKSEKKESSISNGNEYIDAFGGKDNIVSAEAKSSRLVVVLNDDKKIDEAKLKELGLDSLIKATNKITFIVGEKSQAIAKELNK
jgi:PTS system glucose-specific IIC component